MRGVLSRSNGNLSSTGYVPTPSGWVRSPFASVVFAVTAGASWRGARNWCTRRIGVRSALAGPPAHARGWACRYAARSRSTDTWV